MDFTRLRLAGFKSFADAVEIELLPGLTGIIGPNGCGKSNFTEAMRWAMGEGRAGGMRADAMDEVIFAGAAGRPGRNVAEVTIGLLRDGNVIEVTRTITRGEGSAYRLNGTDARQRDVQLLFADAATGSHAAALVGQGRIAAVIAAKATERRQMLEEAAGIAGLAVRRKEAEARLRAAAINLARVEDLGRELEAQAASLKRQARAAERFAELSTRIRTAQARLLFAGWRAAATRAVGAAETTADADLEAERAGVEIAVAEAGLSEAAAQLLQAREAEARARTDAERLARAAKALEEARMRDALRAAELEAQAVALARDLARETALAAEARTELARAAAAIASIDAGAMARANEEQEARALLAAAEAALPEDERAMAEALEARARCAAQQASLKERREAARALLARWMRELETIERDRRALSAAEPAREPTPAPICPDETASPLIAAAEAARVRLATTVDDVEAKRAVLEQARATSDHARDARDSAQADMDAAAPQLMAARARVAAIESEMAGLATETEAASERLPLRAAPGFERAIAAALGGDIDQPAGLEGDGWARIAPRADDPALPAGCAPLAPMVDAPEELARRLAQVGVVNTLIEGDVLAPRLAPGQRLVSREGALWRWDGFDQRSAASSAAAARLSARNRFSVLRGELAVAHSGLAPLEIARARAAARRDETLRTMREADAARAQAAQELARAQACQASAVRAHHDAEARAVRARALAEERAVRAAAEAEARHARANADALARAGRIAALEQAEARAREDRERAEADLSDTDARFAAAAIMADAEAAFEAARATAEVKRSARDRASRRVQDATTAGSEAARLLAAASGEREVWTARVAMAEARLADLAERVGALEAERNARPKPDSGAEADAQRVAERARAEVENVAAARNAAEAALVAAQAVLAAAQEARSSWREARAAAAVEEQHSVRAVEELVQAALQAHDCAPEELPDRFAFAPDDVPIELREAELERLTRERERLGAVNMRALLELEELGGRVAALDRERGEVETAIARLRGSVGALNREGRARLLSTFEGVDRRFRQLFATLFEGGQAKLALIDSEDVLDAGLEVSAKPPGKATQSLALLSGGEQALTAIALLFAFFLENPAPICVLDEVDAPLDDANVERFCDLLREVAASMATRFLVVTHNPVTMASMDRLYGVTMGEPGVSQLVSVDLAAAEALIAAA